MLQKKEQNNKRTLKNPNETEINNLPDKEFREVAIRMLTELGKRTDEHNENFKKEIENIKKNQSRS